MIKEIKNQNISHKAFTLVEMIIVLIIMGILLMVTVYLSWEQIQKVKDKTVKESILAEMQSRYSRNLWSSSFAWEMYDTMEVNIKKWENKIDFSYKDWGAVKLENIFTDNFEIKYIAKEWSTALSSIENINLSYHPYKISCDIWSANDNIVIITRVNDSRYYCFEIKNQNCRLIEMSEEKCNLVRDFVWLIY